MDPGFTATGRLVFRKTAKYRPWWLKSREGEVLVPYPGNLLSYLPCWLCRNCKLVLINYGKFAELGTGRLTDP